LDLVVGAIAGMLASSGVLFIPALSFLFWFPHKVAVGTTWMLSRHRHLPLIPTGAAATSTSAAHGSSRWVFARRILRGWFAIPSTFSEALLR